MAARRPARSKGDDELDPMKAAATQSEQKVLPG
jgi:hypothetical protein